MNKSLEGTKSYILLAMILPMALACYFILHLLINIVIVTTVWGSLEEWSRTASIVYGLATLILLVSTVWVILTVTFKRYISKQFVVSILFSSILSISLSFYHLIASGYKIFGHFVVQDWVIALPLIFSLLLLLLSQSEKTQHDI